MRLIDDAFLSHLRNKKAECEKYGYVEQAIAEAIEDIIADIENAPTVDAVEVVHGRWIDATEYCGEFMCSNCDELCCSNKYNYCPHCGAKMDGGNNNV